jgi:hypothetical protein
MGAGIMIIVQYGYSGDYFDFEVKAGGKVAVSANVKFTDTAVSSYRCKFSTYRCMELILRSSFRESR